MFIVYVLKLGVPKLVLSDNFIQISNCLYRLLYMKSRIVVIWFN